MRCRDELSVTVDVDDILIDACAPFDYSFSGTSVFPLPSCRPPSRDGKWSIGLIVGPSGSGKTQLARKFFGITPARDWNPNKAIASHFTDSQEAIKRLTSVGLNSIPSWCRPYHVLSNGEQFRASMAASISSDTCFDEFTSVVDRTVARSTSHAVQRFVRNSGMTGVVFVSCHRDIIEWLSPDWTLDTLSGDLSPRGSLRRQAIAVDVSRCDRSWWRMFRSHHYLVGSLNESAECYLAKVGRDPVAFGSCLAMPCGTVRNAWRGHRTVVLPDYQGLGIGVRLSDLIAGLCADRGRRYFSKTSHPRMGQYRDKSPLWRATSKNGVMRAEKIRANTYGRLDRTFRRGKRCYSHEYVGLASS